MDQLKFEEYFKAVVENKALPHPETLAELSAVGLSKDDFVDANNISADSYAQNDPFLWLRGKYLIKAVSIFLKQIEAQLRLLHKKGVIRQFNNRVHPDFGLNILFERLTGYAATDPDLKIALFCQTE